MILLFTVELKLLPASGMYSLYGGGDLIDLLKHLIMPSTALAIVSTGVVVRLSRSIMLEILRLDFIRTARSKGLKEYRVIFIHAFRLAIVSILPILGLQTGFVLSGAVYIEIVFQWPGIGRMLVDSIKNKRYNVSTGWSSFCSFMLCFIQYSSRFSSIDLRSQDQRIMKFLFSKIIRNKLALLGSIILFMLLILIIITPFLNLSDPNSINTSDRFSLPFTNNYLLGADHLGRDILSRVMWGTRLSLAVGFSAALIAAILGTFIGIIAGYFGGFFDNILMRSVDVLMAFPYVLLALGYWQ